MKKMLAAIAISVIGFMAVSGELNPKLKTIASTTTNTWLIETNSVVYLRNFAWATSPAVTNVTLTATLTRIGENYTLNSQVITGLVTSITTLDPYRILDGRKGDKITLISNQTGTWWFEIFE